MPAKTEAQRRLMGAALAIKRGAKSSNAEARKLADEMSEEQLKDFATKESFTLKDYLALFEAKKPGKKLKRAAQSVYHRDYERTKHKSYREYDPAAYRREKGSE